MNAKIRILTYKQYLKDTDYQAIKFAEGEMSAEDYAPIKAKRQKWRRLINELEPQALAQEAAELEQEANK